MIFSSVEKGLSLSRMVTGRFREPQIEELEAILPVISIGGNKTAFELPDGSVLNVLRRDGRAVSLTKLRGWISSKMLDCLCCRWRLPP